MIFCDNLLLRMFGKQYGLSVSNTMDDGYNEKKKKIQKLIPDIFKVHTHEHKQILT